MTGIQPRVSIITSCYRGERYLASFFDQVVAQSLFPRVEVILVHNEPTPEEIAIVHHFHDQHPTNIQHLIVQPVESLGASWNRGWKASTAAYLCIWNVDDRRTPDSLERQIEYLEKHLEVVMTYGDYVTVSEYGLESGWYRVTPAEFDRKLFTREFPQGGAFLVWRKSLSERIGYFDEQFKGGADFDLSVRIALHDLITARTEGCMGYFTDAEQGISTREGASIAAIERTVIQLRYGIFDLVRWEHLAAAREYWIDRAFF